MKAGSSGPQSRHEDQGKEVDSMYTSGAAQLNIITVTKCILRCTWRMVVYIYFITAARNSISLQLGSSCQSHRYGMEKVGEAIRPVHHIQIHTRWITLLQPARKAGILEQPSSLRPHYVRQPYARVDYLYPPLWDFEPSLCEQKQWPLTIVITKPRKTAIQDPIRIKLVIWILFKLTKNPITNYM